MTSQNWSHVKYLIQTYNILVFLVYSKLMRNIAALAVFNTIQWWFYIVAYFFGPRIPKRLKYSGPFWGRREPDKHERPCKSHRGHNCGSLFRDWRCQADACYPAWIRSVDLIDEFQCSAWTDAPQVPGAIATDFSPCRTLMSTSRPTTISAA